ncbi:MAG: formimidoylglutamate deiminase [Burkholderiales bacterium]
MKRIFAPEAMLADGWSKDVVIEIDDDGNIAAVRSHQALGDMEATGGPVIPGMANVHSHAFQRAMAGLAEHMGSPEDSFWTWREVMYSFLKQITPEQVHAIAAQLYCEMLRNGYTAVAEFHYLHNAPDGKPYANRAELSQRHLLAAQQTGIAITLLPSLYAYANFGEEPLQPAQKRFAITPDAVLDMIAGLRRQIGDNPDIRLGVAPHSLRAVSPAMLKDLVAGLAAIDRKAPIHIHVAEQVKEVNDCISWSEQRPADWLLSNMPVDARWCLVHCTHVSQTEAEKLAASGAVVGLCPTTEGNLGDGIFQFARFREKGGRWSVGGDSHVSQTPVEELRWLEYVQRLSMRRRNIAASPALPSVGATLWREAAAGGSQALARPMGALAPGMRADLVVLDPEHINLVGRSGDSLLDAFVFAGNGQVVKHVMVGGRWVVRDGHHPDEAAIARRYREVKKELQQAL